MNGVKRIAVIGGGAAGLMACCHALDLGCRVTLFERNSLLGMKLGITGKGRCNLTNDCSPAEFMQNLTKNGKFMFSAINRFSPADTKAYVESLGVPLKTERGNRVFPVSDKATDVVLAMKNHITAGGCKIINERVSDIEITTGRITAIITQRRRFEDFDDVILCTGGLSYPVTGSSGDGYALAEKVGHSVTERIPSLVGVECSGDICARMQGLSLKNVEIKVVDNEKKSVIYSDFGEMLFTHFGLSGPLVLSASAHMRPMKSGKFSILIDEKPALSAEVLDRRILSDFEKYKNKQLKNALGDLLPQKMTEPFTDMCGVDGNTPINSITKVQRKAIVDTMKAMPFVVTGFRPISEAIVTSGGINVKEINPATMKSKLCENLFFAGEIIDVDAYTGGFNLQIAFSSAVAAVYGAINN